MERSNSPDSENRLDEIIAEYLKQVEAGRAPSRGEMIKQHADFAKELGDFFDDQDQLDRMALLAEPAPTSSKSRSMDRRLLEEGQVIRGTYEVERFLGEGAFAEVFRVKHRFLGRQAMKVLKMVGMTREETEEMLGEAIILSRIGHPNIVRVFEANTTETGNGPCSFFTMEYVAGGSLEQFWRSHGARFMPIETVIEIMKQICRGLAVAHREDPPIIHRDIKPQNILVGYDATGLRVRVSDFGLAKRVNPLTLLASARGTPNFKPPEAFRNEQGDSCAADVWALGSTLYLLLTDKLPYAELSRSFSPEQRFSRPFTPPSQINILVDSALDRIVARALAMSPSARQTNAQVLLDDLNNWKPTSARPSATDQLDWSETTKTALGRHSPANEALARSMAAKAVKLAQQSDRLTEAKDLMEEALNHCPDLRRQFEYDLKLWHRGITM